MYVGVKSAASTHILPSEIKNFDPLIESQQFIDIVTIKLG